MAQLFIGLAGVSGFLAVALGAFGAHALKQRLPEDLLAIYHTAVQYQFWHTAALLAVGLLLLHFPQQVLLKYSGWAFVAGVVIFSGSLYVLAFTGTRWLGAITPIGGVAFLLGWALLALAMFRKLA
ncbi:MAG: DUF423 domain-containing protein [Gammaproteobacteria bacterium]|nr:MAG: DUF423 domain-containing protein [Gammaproteobacteria bacterium]